MPSQHSAAPSSVFLDRIYRELDLQLNKLQSARDTIAGLSKPVSSFELYPTLPLETVAAPEPQPETVQPDVAQPGRRGRPKGSRNRFPSVRRSRQQPAPEPRALASSIPTGPVVVSAAELTRRREAAAAAQHPVETRPIGEGTLEALIREVKERAGAEEYR